MVPQSSSPGSWRFISDLSNQLGGSVNYIVPKLETSVNYVGIDEAIDALGRGALMAKFDLAHAYRLIIIHPDDRCLLGMK